MNLPIGMWESAGLSKTLGVLAAERLTPWHRLKLGPLCVERAADIEGVIVSGSQRGYGTAGRAVSMFMMPQNVASVAIQRAIVECVDELGHRVQNFECRRRFRLMRKRRVAK